MSFLDRVGTSRTAYGLDSERGGDWRDQALCANRDHDHEMWFPIGTTGPAIVQASMAIAVCNRCPVIAECLRHALGAGIDDGIWGGMTEAERRSMIRRGGRPRPAPVPVAPKPPQPERSATHCSAGHEWTPENTYMHPDTSRYGKSRTCRECQRVSALNRRTAKRQRVSV